MPGMLTSLTMTSGLLPQRHLEAAAAVAGDQHLEAFELEEVLHDRHDRRAVLDDEHAAPRAGPARRPLRPSAAGGGAATDGTGVATRTPATARRSVAASAALVRRDHAQHFLERRQALRRFLDAVLEHRAHAGARAPRLRISCSDARLAIRSRTSSLTSSTS